MTKKLTLFLITLTTIMNVSYASFPVNKIIEEPSSGNSNILVFVLAAIISIYGLVSNKRKYGTYYNPNKKYGKWIGKNWWILLLVVIGILALGMSAMKMK